MRKHINIIIFAATAAAFACSCTPDDGGKLGDRITDLRIVVTATSTPNVYHLEANRKDIIGFWDLGNNLKVDAANEAYAEYPFKGDYTVTLTAYNNGGRTNTVSVVVPVTENNVDLLSDPVYELLAGELGSREGKTWVMDSLLYGHLANLNTSNLAGTPNNMALNVDAPEKAAASDLRLGRTLYDDKATFILSSEDGQAFRYVNNGSSLVTNTGSNGFKDQVFMKAKSWSPTTAVSCAGQPLPTGFTGAYNSDWQISCIPPSNMGWYVEVVDGRYFIRFPSVADGPGGFLLFALDWTSGYEIMSLTEDRMVLNKETLSGASLTTRSVRRLVLIRDGSTSGLELDNIPEEGSYIE